MKKQPDYYDKCDHQIRVFQDVCHQCYDCYQSIYIGEGVGRVINKAVAKYFAHYAYVTEWFAENKGRFGDKNDGKETTNGTDPEEDL